jgi:16S rRNA processing protein RimM
MDAADGQGRVLLGIVTGAQGVRGAVRVKSFTADPADVGAYGPLSDERGARRFRLAVVGQSKGVVIARIDGVEDRDAAEALRGVRLYVERAALPPPDEEEYYHADLVGMAAVLADGSPFGRVVAVHDFGAGDSLEVERPEGGTILVPFSRAAVPVVDVEARRLVVEPPEGLLDNRPVETELGADAETEPPELASEARE